MKLYENYQEMVTRFREKIRKNGKYLLLCSYEKKTRRVLTQICFMPNKAENRDNI